MNNKHGKRLVSTMNRADMKHAVVVGGGTMGGGIAASFCAGGWQTHVVEVERSIAGTLPERIDICLEQMGVKDGLGNLIIHGVLETPPWDQISLVIECVSEKLELKRNIFGSVEKLTRAGVPITSNSSSFPISEIAQGLKTRHRMAGLHYFMPAHLIPLVEVVSSQDTDEATIKFLCELMIDLSKRPVWVKKDIPGFLANRIQHALMREAIYMVEQGIATPEDVDAAVRLSFGIRFMGAGPLLQKDLSGLDVQCAAAARIYPDLCNSDKPSALLQKLVDENHIGTKTLKGFYDWDAQKIKQKKQLYESTLIKALELIEDK